MRKSLLALGFVAVVSLLFAANPATTEWYPKCPFLLLTGFYCPGCGSLRALHQLSHLHFEAAWSYNPLLVLLLPALLAMHLSSRLMYSVRLARSVLALVILFGILRNVPGVALDSLRPAAGSSVVGARQ